MVEFFFNQCDVGSHSNSRECSFTLCYKFDDATLVKINPNYFDYLSLGEPWKYP
jgi:hypothetical protein